MPETQQIREALADAAIACARQAEEISKISGAAAPTQMYAEAAKALAEAIDALSKLQ